MEGVMPSLQKRVIATVVDVVGSAIFFVLSPKAECFAFYFVVFEVLVTEPLFPSGEMGPNLDKCGLASSTASTTPMMNVHSCANKLRQPCHSEGYKQF